MTAYKNDRKYLQTIYLMRDLYLEYVVNSHNSVIKRLSLLKKKKNNGGSEYAFSKEDVQMTCKKKKMLNIIGHLWNANQNHNEMLLYTSLGGCDQKDRYNYKCWEYGEVGTLTHYW